MKNILIKTNPAYLLHKAMVNTVVFCICLGLELYYSVKGIKK